jgi:hypothetical protein
MIKWAKLSIIKTLGIKSKIILSTVLFKTRFSTNQITPAKTTRMIPATK